MLMKEILMQISKEDLVYLYIRLAEEYTEFKESRKS